LKVKFCTLVISLFCFQISLGQISSGIKGVVLDAQNLKPLKGAVVSLEGLFIEAITRSDGSFELLNVPAGDHIFIIALDSYELTTIPITKIPGKTLDLSRILLEKDYLVHQTTQTINLNSDDLLEEGGSDGNYALLQATRDVFLNRAAFDFSQAFYRLRGYDWKEGSVALNGIEMNKLFNGRAQWNNWGGLNDITRNQNYTFGLAPSALGFGGMLGLTNINLRPSFFRPGLRLSSSFSNRTYAGRAMATYNSGSGNDDLSYSVSASRRWAGEGYLDGTLYDSYAAFLALEYKLSTKQSLVLTGILSSNRRGQSAPVTREVFNLVGRKYNPNWGIQNGEVRNARTRLIREPIVMLNYFYDNKNLNLNLGASYQFGVFTRNRLSYFNAPNPDPVYYRYLPSYYINQRTPNFENAALAREGFRTDPQINWTDIYEANNATSLNGKSAYLIQQDHTDDTQLNFNGILNYRLTKQFKLDTGIDYSQLNSNNYAEIGDLLGSSFHEDIDAFSNTRNDLNGELVKRKGDAFAYNYKMKAVSMKSFMQLRYTSKRWDGFLSAKWERTSYERQGLFLNERFPDNSLGNSAEVTFSDFGTKAGLTFRWNARHIFSLNGAFLNRPPVLQNVFINPRENNEVVPKIASEKVKTVEFNYFLRWKALKGRITSYYTTINNVTDINFFYVESGVGNDFVQEVLTGAGHKHFGIEMGLEHQFSSDVKLTAAIGLGNHSYSENANLTINFDTSGDEDQIINTQGRVDLGTAAIKDYRLPTGPQIAAAVGMEYRNPDYWWLGITANYLTQNFTDISKITRTQSFLINPETNIPFPDASQEAVDRLLRQESLEDIYLLNLVGGKSWLLKETYISAFISINNIFDLTYRTGGFEQSRNGNFGSLKTDNARDNPSFGPKHWYGSGRTFFLNLAVNF
jgi:hypothetical protein